MPAVDIDLKDRLQSIMKKLVACNASAVFSFILKIVGHAIIWETIDVCTKQLLDSTKLTILYFAALIVASNSPTATLFNMFLLSRR